MLMADGLQNALLCLLAQERTIECAVTSSKKFDLRAYIALVGARWLNIVVGLLVTYLHGISCCSVNTQSRGLRKVINELKGSPDIHGL